MVNNFSAAHLQRGSHAGAAHMTRGSHVTGAKESFLERQRTACPPKLIPR